MDHQQLALRFADRVGVGVELSPDRLALPGLCVDHDDRSVGLCVLGDVSDRSGAGLGHVNPGNVGQQRAAWAEAVVAVQLRRKAGLAFDVLGKLAGAEVEPQAGVGALLRDGVEVARERQDAGARVERIAARCCGATSWNQRERSDGYRGNSKTTLKHLLSPLDVGSPAERIRKLPLERRRCGSSVALLPQAEAAVVEVASAPNCSPPRLRPGPP